MSPDFTVFTTSVSPRLLKKNVNVKGTGHAPGRRGPGRGGAGWWGPRRRWATGATARTHGTGTGAPTPGIRQTGINFINDDELL